MTTRTAHPETIQRLRPAEGPLRGIIAIQEDGRSCLHVAQRLQAVERAIASASAKKTWVRAQIDHRLDHAEREGAQSADDALPEVKAITKYL